MGLWEWIILAFVIGGILYAFDIPNSVTWTRNDWRWAGSKLVKVVLFIPIILIGAILHVAKDFKNYKVGYVVLFLAISVLIFGFVMGMLAGPESLPVE